jgi:hypothetical protein
MKRLPSLLISQLSTRCAEMDRSFDVGTHVENPDLRAARDLQSWEENLQKLAAAGASWPRNGKRWEPSSDIGEYPRHCYPKVLCFQPTAGVLRRNR